MVGWTRGFDMLSGRFAVFIVVLWMSMALLASTWDLSPNVINLPKNKDILIKIDVQGYEKFVLEGANKNLSKIKYIIIELSNKKFYDFQIKNNEMINFLKKKNFRLIKYFNKNFLGKKNYQADYLFINENLEN